MVGVLEDRTKKEEDPPFIRLKPSCFEWRSVRLGTDREDSGWMAMFYNEPANKGESCHLEGGGLEMDGTQVPKIALVPAKLAADALEEEYTPWEVYNALVDIQEGKSHNVKILLNQCKYWALAAALRGNNSAETSKMAYILTPISGALAWVMRGMKTRLVGTLGMYMQEKPKGGPPAFLP